MNPEISATETKNNVERMICFHRNIRRGQSPDSIMQHVERAMTVAELREVAKERGIKVTTKMTKTALVELLGA